MSEIGIAETENVNIDFGDKLWNHWQILNSYCITSNVMPAGGDYVILYLQVI